MSTSYENLPPNHPQGIHGSGSRPTPAHFMTRSFSGPHGPRPGPHVPNGRMSPSSMPAMHGHPGRTPFNSPMPGMPMPPRSAMHPGMIPPHMQAELTSLQLFIALSFVHGAIDLLERLTIVVRDYLWYFIYN